MRPNKGGKRVVPQPGGESFLIGEAAAPSYEMPMPGKVTLVQLIPVGDWQIGEAAPLMTPEEDKAYCEREGILDPDRPLIPTIEELAKLPRWARVAFLARCARRVFPICRYSCPTVPASQSESHRRCGCCRRNRTRRQDRPKRVSPKKGPITIQRCMLPFVHALCSVERRGRRRYLVASAVRVATDPDVHASEGL